MFGKKFSSNIRRKKRMIISSIILLVVFLGIGYSAFTTNLGINGTLKVDKYDHTLYGVLEKAAKVGTYAKEYTGEHQDSMAGVGDKKIYHWYAENNTNAGNSLATEILDKNNVIFADHCWQMFRTTDTGGVKMIYNGEVEDGKCLNTRENHVGYSNVTTTSLLETYYYGTSYTYNKTTNVFSLDGTITTGTIQSGQYTCKSTSSTETCSTLYLVNKLRSGTTYYVLPLKSNSHYSQFGELQMNIDNNVLSGAGYMYNTLYDAVRIEHYENYYSAAIDINPNYYFSESIDYGTINSEKYTLINPIQISSINDYNDLVGKYFLLNGSNGSDSNARYILSVNDTKIYYKSLSNGNLEKFITIGDTYTNNGNNTYTINSPTIITYSDLYNNYSNYNKKYMCIGTSATCSDIRHIAQIQQSQYHYYSPSIDAYNYSENISYNNGIYTLMGDIKEIWDISDSETQEIISTHHYTCLEDTTTCTNVKYLYRLNTSSYLISYYIVLANGDNIEVALTKMLNADNINQNNSVMKLGIDAWYQKYMINYTAKLEDTIFCNDRTIKELNGWDSNGGKITDYLTFYGANIMHARLTCPNTTDRFSLANNKAKLTYPIGLSSLKELEILGNGNIRKTGKNYGLLTPAIFNVSAGFYLVSNSGSFGFSTGMSASGVRPTISLKPGTEYVNGTGSMANPYVVE